MCGIAGFIGQRWIEAHDAAQSIVTEMGNRLIHRGPDGSGTWIDEQHGMAFVHRRLSILDTSPLGAQPMVSRSGRYVVTYNGEIYNHREIRQQIPRDWKGESDTETFLAAAEAWGVERATKALAGMFAFALWDRKEAILTLGRDRLGEKPLYYTWRGNSNRRTFIFASELSAMRAHPEFVPEVDRDAVARFMRYNNVVGDSAIYKDVFKLPPGNLLRLNYPNDKHVISPYWSFSDHIVPEKERSFINNESGAVNSLEDLLGKVVDQQMISDVPLGAFLSGGVDSSLVAALMQKQSQSAVKTFSIGFDEEQYNEAPHAKAVANHLGTDHHELFVSATDALALIPKLGTIYSEPFADSSQIPTYLLSQLTKEHVTVALSGDGGDELFGGYNRYQITQSIWPKLSRIPVLPKRIIAHLLQSVSPSTWDHLANRLAPHVSAFSKWSNIGEKIHKGAFVIGSNDIDALYTGLISHWDDPTKIAIGSQESEIFDESFLSEIGHLGNAERMMALDLMSYLPGDIMTKVDRAAMASSLETRMPLLDHRIVEFAWTIPADMKLRGNDTKWLLKQLLYRHVPKELIERPKAGFSVPLDSWLRGPLREWAEELLDETRLKEQGFINPQPVRDIWNEHLSGKKNWQHRIWTILMFQSWMEASHLS